MLEVEQQTLKAALECKVTAQEHLDQAAALLEYARTELNNAYIKVFPKRIKADVNGTTLELFLCSKPNFDINGEKITAEYRTGKGRDGFYYEIGENTTHIMMSDGRHDIQLSSEVWGC